MKPLVYACSGCSKAGDAAYQVAQCMNRQGVAEMSCVVGLAAGKAKFRREALNRRIILIDGCMLNCTKGLFEQLHIKESLHINLVEYGIYKNGQPLNLEEAKTLTNMVLMNEKL